MKHETTDPDLQEALSELDAELEAAGIDADGNLIEAKEEDVVESKEEEASDEEATSSAPDEEQVASAESDEAAQDSPAKEEEKILGKFNSQQDLEKSYVELERWASQQASERAAFQRQIDELKGKLEKPTQDPLEDFDKLWDEDPQAATKAMLQRQREEARQAEEQGRIQAEQAARVEQARQYYEQNKAENPDFVELEPVMISASERFAHIIRPEYAASKEVMEALYYISRGQNVDKYEKAAIEKTRKQTEAIKAEKRKAKSESSFSEGSNDSPDYIEDLDKFQELLEKGDQKAIDEDLRRMQKRMS